MIVNATVTDRREVNRTVQVDAGHRIEYSKAIENGKTLWSSVRLLTSDEAYEWKESWRIGHIELARHVAEAILLVTEGE